MNREKGLGSLKLNAVGLVSGHYHMYDRDDLGDMWRDGYLVNSEYLISASKWGGVNNRLTEDRDEYLFGKPRCDSVQVDNPQSKQRTGHGLLIALIAYSVVATIACIVCAFFILKTQFSKGAPDGTT